MENSTESLLRRAEDSLLRMGVLRKTCRCGKVFWLPESSNKKGARYCCPQCASAASSERYRERGK